MKIVHRDAHLCRHDAVRFLRHFALLVQLLGHGHVPVLHGDAKLGCVLLEFFASGTSQVCLEKRREKCLEESSVRTLQLVIPRDGEVVVVGELVPARPGRSCPSL